MLSLTDILRTEVVMLTVIKRMDTDLDVRMTGGFVKGEREREREKEKESFFCGFCLVLHLLMMFVSVGAMGG